MLLYCVVLNMLKYRPELWIFYMAYRLYLLTDIYFYIFIIRFENEVQDRNDLLRHEKSMFYH